MKKRYLFLTVLLIVMIAGATIGGTMSYFTTYADAKGGQPIHLGYSTRINETFVDHVKHLTIVNEKNSQPVYIRAKAFSGSKYLLSISGEGWSQTPPSGTVLDDAAYEDNSDYWYYQTYLETQPDDASDDATGAWVSSPLDVAITNFPADTDGEEGDSFNVVVVYESTPVKYTKDGTPYADWSTVLDARKVEGGN